MKLFWMGTDSLMLIDYSKRTLRKKVYWWLFRRLIRISDYFIESHYCVSDNVADNVIKFGTKKPIKIVIDQCNTEKYEKKSHKGFNVLYYFKSTRRDNEFQKWLYGYDIFLRVKERFPDINFIVVDGTYNMSKIYPLIDFCLRPNRHDGHPRMIDECKIQGIPYYWSKTDPIFEDICSSIIKAMDKWETF